MTTHANTPGSAGAADAEPTGSGRAQPAAAQTADAAPPWNVLTILLVPVFMMTLDIFIVNVAIPSIQTEPNASPAAVQFVISGFALAISILLLIVFTVAVAVLVQFLTKRAAKAPQAARRQPRPGP
ncbi:MAG TPA: hypothetical protein VGS97_27510 [Actinocrinis sp.]|uniref:hypothetical protein n=1 Tax=Actinocrinis sp. TaxID=1920516 RepID=UPI002DDCE27A|nr:hypothetical protein [Actinocrinis sp.]HEV2347867.1 hypothetical protein [Actinocrinis sp.]